MISDKLYELAFEYKKAKLWQSLWDACIFAVKLTDGRIGYISIMGALGEYCALGLYIGEEGFNSFRAVTRDDSLFMPGFAMDERAMKQNCLHCAFEGKDELSGDEREEAKEYARGHGIRISGRNAYPHFVKYLPYRAPWHLQTEQEQEDLCEALSAALEVARLLKEKTAKELGIVRIDDGTEEVPMLVRKDGAYVLEKTQLPKEKEEKWPEPQAVNDINIAKLKKISRSGVWECGIVRLAEPVKDVEEEIPFFPVVFLAVDNSTDYILPISPVLGYEQKPEELLDLFIEALLIADVCPAEMKVRDERSYALVKDFCGRMNIAVCIEDDLPALDDAEFEFMAHMGYGEEDGMDKMDEMDEVAFMLDELLQMDASRLRELPEGMLKQIELLMDQGAFPKEIEKRFRKLLQIRDSGNSESLRLVKKDIGRAKAGKASKASKEVLKGSYVISVSLGTGCYRHIRISANDTLIKLHAAILDAFSFGDDHAHAFFMDNRVWSDWDSYYAKGVEPGLRTTDRHKLGQAGLCKGKQFKYVFDFGDEWTFQCKVLKEMEENTDKPVIIKSKGEAPPQYPDWDEDWDDEWDDE